MWVQRLWRLPRIRFQLDMIQFLLRSMNFRSMNLSSLSNITDATRPVSQATFADSMSCWQRRAGTHLRLGPETSRACREQRTTCRQEAQAHAYAKCLHDSKSPAVPSRHLLPDNLDFPRVEATALSQTITRSLKAHIAPERPLVCVGQNRPEKPAEIYPD